MSDDMAVRRLNDLILTFHNRCVEKLGVDDRRHSKADACVLVRVLVGGKWIEGFPTHECEELLTLNQTNGHQVHVVATHIGAFEVQPMPNPFSEWLHNELGTPQLWRRAIQQEALWDNQ